jgi:hypothetical protein
MKGRGFIFPAFLYLFLIASFHSLSIQASKSSREYDMYKWWNEGRGIEKWIYLNCHGAFIGVTPF